MVLVLKNDQMKDLLPMGEEIDAIEQAFRELGQGVAMNAPRARLRTPWKEEGGQYYFNNIMGLVPGVKSMALRIDSSFSKEVQIAGSKRRVYPGDYIGLVMLFDMDTCEILAMMDDHHISTMRVGATSAVASKYLARKDAKVLGLLGSGEQARTQVTAHLSVRPLTKVKVYSPTKENREQFAREMSRETGVEVVPMASAEEAVRGSDIVSAATNTVDPVVQGRWLEAGMHVTSLVGGDGFLPTKGARRRGDYESRPHRGWLQTANFYRQTGGVSRSPRAGHRQSRRLARARGACERQVPRPQGRPRDHLFQEQYRHGDPICRHGPKDVRESQGEGDRRGASFGLVHDATG